MAQQTPVHTLIPSKKKPFEEISEDQVEQLKVMFFMDGITKHAAAAQVGVHPSTVARYFEMWAEEITKDPENEKWTVRHKRVLARALEGKAKKIIELSKRKHTLERLYGNLIYQKPPEGEEPTKIKLLSTEEHMLVLNYETRILALDKLLDELQNEYNAIEASPPAEAVLKKEVIQLINEIQTGN